MNSIIEPVRHGLIMAIAALMMGAFWAAYMATHHEQLHSAFEIEAEKNQQAQMKHLMHNLLTGDEKQEAPDDTDTMKMNHDHPESTPADHHQKAVSGHQTGNHNSFSDNPADAQHSHSGSLAKDAMQRLLRGHIHFMGIGVLAAILLIITAFTSLKACWKKVLGWTFGLGALAYPPAWIAMGFRTVEMGPQAAEASIMWLFGPAVGLLLASMSALFVVLLLEATSLQYRIPALKACFIDRKE